MIDIFSQNLGGGGQQVGGSGGSRSTDIALPKPVNTAQQLAVKSAPVQNVHVPNDQAIHDAVQKRISSLRQSISEALPRFFMPVSDVKFTIYKNSQGELVTKITNIVSGETQQIPEQNMLTMVSNHTAGAQTNFIQTSA